MKFKTTSKELRNKVASKYLFKCGYCDLQHLLHFVEPIAYASGVYGWNYDVYKIDDIYITTGYRSMVGQSINYEVIRKYEEQAKTILNTWGLYTHEEKKERISELLKEFINEIFN